MDNPTRVASYHLAGEYGSKGPIAEYDARIKSGKLRNDEHQRSTLDSPIYRKSR